MRILLFLLALNLGCSAANEPLQVVGGNDSPPEVQESDSQSKEDSAISFLAVGEYKVDIMELRPDKQSLDVAARIAAAVKSNPKWYVALGDRRQAGKPLPYDERMGVSEAEYKAFLSSWKNTTFQKNGTARLKIALSTDGAFVFDADDALKGLKGVTVHPEKNQVQTPYGLLTDKSTINSSADSQIGAVRGLQWKLPEAASLEKLASVKFVVGRFAESNRMLITYDAKALESGEMKQTFYVLEYDATAK